MSLLTAGQALLPGPAQAASVGSAATRTCSTEQQSRQTQKRTPDTEPVSRAQSIAIEKAMAAKLAELPQSRGAGTGPITINVRAHIIRGTHKGDPYLTRANLDKTIAWMNQAYGGQASSGASDTGFQFQLYSVDTTRNDRWYHSAPQSAASKQMRRKLRVGHSFGLNIYFLHMAKTAGAATLGFSTFPWAFQKYPHLDGVQINIGSVPGGWLPRYNSGDTVVHEVGHWLGLYHTFQNGCFTPGDSVADTPYEAYPEFDCAEVYDSCPDRPGNDPTNNYMDYSLDSCMDQFTSGQATRMNNAFAAYRTS